MRHFDHTVITWVMQHLNVAIKYIEHSGKGTERRPEEVIEKYMHPKYQRRIFFPELWSAEELGVEI
jgi:tryptophan 2,3-dioxygenase